MYYSSIHHKLAQGSIVPLINQIERRNALINQVIEVRGATTEVARIVEEARRFASMTVTRR